ncbi:unnamed protein product [Prorocentrum cordatum]|uniref:Uncharacterized protein n=1 Tax=Prorocentrum cordatum TaxID=2364126 RepID=A0ABN9X1N1_9DINO|nr:unnamed protein product [Polarella glacialis]
MAPAVATTTITSMRTTVRNTFLELLADGDAEDGAVSVPLRRTSSSPCLLTYGAGARQISDDVSCPDLGPDVESYDSEDDDVCCLWGPAGRAPPALPGPSDLLHVQPWPCAPAKEGPDCCSKRLPGLSDLLQLQTNSKPTTAAGHSAECHSHSGDARAEKSCSLSSVWRAFSGHTARETLDCKTSVLDVQVGRAPPRRTHTHYSLLSSRAPLRTTSPRQPRSPPTRRSAGCFGSKSWEPGVPC